jgi:nitrite reductase/ring-hydroxylating ferredoxin subunit
MPTIDYMDCFRTGSDTIAGKYMRRFWHPVFRAEDLKSGWAKPIRIMGEDFTLYRGESGRPQVVDFRCPHRQSTLSVGWVEGDCIRCRFHGWKFDRSGQCVKKENLGRSDTALILQRKIWVRELQALTDGAPLTTWHRPERLAQLVSYSHLPEAAQP